MRKGVWGRFAAVFIRKTGPEISVGFQILSKKANDKAKDLP